MTYTHSADPDQGLHCLPLHYFKKQLSKKQNLGKKKKNME